MKGRTGGLIALLLGILLVAAAIVIWTVILPAQAQFPDDVDTHRYYEGNLAVMLNPTALATGDLANVLVTDVPVAIDRHVTTEDTDGSKALVLEDAILATPDGTELNRQQKWYAIDRETMEHIANFTDNTNVVDARQGLVVGFPMDTEQRDYIGWSDDYAATVTLTFMGVEDHQGVEAYYFESASGPQPIADPAALGFPTQIPQALLLQLAPSLAPPELLGQLAALLPSLGDPVPFSYTYEYSTKYWVEPKTGVIIDYEKVEKRAAVLMSEALPGGGVPVGTVFDLTYAQTDASVQEAIDDADDAKMKLNLFGVIIPWAAIGIGAVLVLLGAFLIVRRKGAPAAA